MGNNDRLPIPHFPLTPIAVPSLRPKGKRRNVGLDMKNIQLGGVRYLDLVYERLSIIEEVSPQGE